MKNKVTTQTTAILKYCPCGGDLLFDDTTNTLYCEKAHLGGNHYRESVLGVCGGCAMVVYETDGHYICDHCRTPFHSGCFVTHEGQA